jgi:PST family polysaccharide transporter
VEKLPRKQVVTSFGWAASGTLLQGIAQILSVVFLARLLSPYEFGVVSIAILVTQMSLVFSEFGVGPCIVQAKDLTDRFLGTSFRLSCFFGTLVAAALWGTAPTFASAFDVDALTPLLRIYAIIFLVKGWAAPAEALLQRDLEFRYLAKADAISFIVGYMGVSVFFAWLGAAYWAIAIGHISQAILKAAFTYMRHPNLSLLPATWRTTVEIIRFGIGQTLSRLASLLGSQADGYVVTTTLGVLPMGLYGRANQLVTMPPAQLGQIFDRVIFPSIARIQTNPRHVAAAYKLSLTTICLISIPVASFIIMFGREFTVVVLGEGWTGVIYPLQILAIAMPFRLIHKVSDPTARAMGATYMRAWRQWLFAAIVLASSVAMSPYGLPGIAAAVVLASIIDATLMLSLCCRMTRLPLREAATALVPGIRLALLVSLAAAPAAILSTDNMSQHISSLLIGLIVMAAITVTSLYRWPRTTIGARGAAAVRIVRGLSTLNEEYGDNL